MTIPTWQLAALLAGVWGATAAAALWLRRRDRLRAVAAMRIVEARKQERRDAAFCAAHGIDWHDYLPAPEKAP